MSEVGGRLRARGLVDTSRRALRRLYRTADAKFGLSILDFPLDPADIASSSSIVATAPFRGTGSQRVAWICTPPGPGSGGHTTFFRMVQAVQDAGHECTVLLYNHHGGDMERHLHVIRSSWPWLTASVEEIPHRISGFSSVVASSWETAHVLATRCTPGEPMNPFYLVQDFEPYFHPRGSLYALAEDTYRFGFTNLALGDMVAQSIQKETGASALTIPFGSDTTNYHFDNSGNRSGVVFFARPGVDRRGFEMGRLALAEFHRRYPEEPIHTYGAVVSGWDFPVNQHGMLTPAALNKLYNETVTGLALSFTNITLVAAEMLAAGNVAVLNDDESARKILRNREAVWCAATPDSLADGMSRIIEDPQRLDRARRSAQFKELTWAVAQEELVRVVGDVSGDR